MRAMIGRTLVVGVVLGAGAMLAPLVAEAAGFVHGGFGFVTGQPLVRPGQMPPAAPSAAPSIRRHVFEREPMRHHRRVPGLELPIVGTGAYDDPTTGPEFDAGTAGQVIQVRVPASGDGAVGDRGGCQTETRTVPSEAGGTRSVRIIRCR